MAPQSKTQISSVNCLIFYCLAVNFSDEWFILKKMEAEAVIVEYEQLLSAFKTRVSPKSLLFFFIFCCLYRHFASVGFFFTACPSNYNRCKNFECKLWQPRFHLSSSSNSTQELQLQEKWKVIKLSDKSQVMCHFWRKKN